MSLGMGWDKRGGANVADLGFLSCIVVAAGVAVVFYELLHGLNNFHC